MEHLSKLDFVMTLPSDLELTSACAASLGPYLQGFLMEHISEAYAEYLHSKPFNPYSLYCQIDKERNSLVWHLMAFTNEAIEQMIFPLQRVDAVEIRALDKRFEIVEKSTTMCSIKELTDLIYEGVDTKPKVFFVTPVAFKRRGGYVFMPEVGLLFQNLLMHYGQIYDNNKEIDQKTIEYISQNVRITSYRLHSQYFEHAVGNGKKIPAFVGQIALLVKGPQPLIGLVNMLLKFGEYAGVGIKTSMGMGGMQCL